MKYYLYVLRSLKDGKLYIGVSYNPSKRLKEHNKGKNKSTKNRRPFELLYTEVFDTKSEAYEYEWKVKNNGEENKKLKARVAKVVTARV